MNEDGEDRCSEPKKKQGIEKGKIHLINHVRLPALLVRT
jgi:hypothetical protein